MEEIGSIAVEKTANIKQPLGKVGEVELAAQKRKYIHSRSIEVPCKGGLDGIHDLDIRPGRSVVLSLCLTGS